MQGRLIEGDTCNCSLEMYEGRLSTVSTCAQGQKLQATELCRRLKLDILKSWDNFLSTEAMMT
ncbi:hypothetical protein C0Q70_07534 [Pomacea canaliculata]|uniref:Uncharacterized protein n=1 Tax=Pomacea canaliculata TaxID=400727 RepID=A0A2T7PFA2_POMCA|nr:hypothetical protein C0Q70_07534 [Pomacea canaliculata]